MTTLDFVGNDVYHHWTLVFRAMPDFGQEIVSVL